MATSWTQADIARLEAAIAGGAAVSSMTFGDQTVTFRSADDMLKLLAVMQRAVAGTSRTRYAATSKGF